MHRSFVMATPHALVDEQWFLELIEERADLPRDLPPRTAATLTICTLAERLTPGQAQHLFDALPPEIQPLFASCRVPYGRPVSKLDDATFLDALAGRLGVTPAHAELIADTVFRAVRTLLPAAVIDHVAVQLPRDLSDLWLGRRAIFAAPTTSFDTAQWELLTDISDAVPLPIGVQPEDALAAVMCTFSSRLSGGEVRDLLLALPAQVRPLVEHCMLTRDERPGVLRDRHDIVMHVADELATSPELAEQIIAAVLTAVKRLIPIKEQGDIASQLPRDLRTLWDEAG